LEYKDRHFEIILYTFPDDLEKAIETRYGKSIDLDKKSKEDRFLIESYLREHFSLEINGKPVRYAFLGYTFENEKILLLMETAPVNKIKNIRLRQSWLTDIYPGQQNIVHVILPDRKISDILTREKTIMTVP
jgi:hypothetical protein